MSRDPARRTVPMRRKGPGGFTLLEILITVVLLAILAAVAIPSYSAYVARGQRAAAKAALMQGAQFLERTYTVSGCYNYGQPADCAVQGGSSAVSLPTALTVAPTDGGTVTYLITPTLASQTFSLAATPCAAAGSCPTGSNSAFTDECGTLSLDNTGAKTVSGGTNTNPAACWGR